MCAGQVRRLRGPGTPRPLTTGGVRNAVSTGSPPRLWHSCDRPVPSREAIFSRRSAEALDLPRRGRGGYRRHPHSPSVSSSPLHLVLRGVMSAATWGCPRLLTQRSVRVPVVCAGLAASRGGYGWCWRLFLPINTGRNAAQIARGGVRVKRSNPHCYFNVYRVTRVTFSPPSHVPDTHALAAPPVHGDPCRVWHEERQLLQLLHTHSERAWLHIATTVAHRRAPLCAPTAPHGGVRQTPPASWRAFSHS